MEKRGCKKGENMKREKGMAFSQIAVLILSTFAFAFIFESGIGVVSAATNYGCLLPGNGGSIPAGQSYENYFCYGGGNYPTVLYTASNGVISAPNGPNGETLYYAQQGGSWVYSASSDMSNSQPISTLPTVNDAPLFTTLAGQASSYTYTTGSETASNYQANQIASANGAQGGSAPGATTAPNPVGTASQVYGAYNTVKSTGILGGGAATAGSTAGYQAAINQQANQIASAYGAPGATSAGASGYNTLFGLSPTTWANIGIDAGNILKSAGWAAAIIVGYNLLIKPLLGNNPTALEIGAGVEYAGIGAEAGAQILPTLLSQLGVTVSGIAAAGIGAGVALVIFALTYKSQNIRTVAFSCAPWQPPLGGANCAECGQDGLPCTAYECQSLGQACQLLNTQGTGQPICVWVDKNNVNPPTISFFSSALPNSTYVATPINAQYPGSTGVNISYNGGGVPAYTLLTLGVQTDMVSKCRVSTNSGDSFDNMSVTFPSPAGGISGAEGIWGTNHTLEVPVMLPQNGSITAQQGGQMELFVKCESANGVPDVSPFVIQFNVNTGPDLTAPTIEGTDIQSGAPVASGTYSTNVSVYINKPVANCKWSHTDQAYTDMSNYMDCSYANDPADMNSIGQYTCIANLTGLKNSQQNNFYFSCKNLNNVTDTQSYPFTLVGTQPLVISSVTPNGTAVIDASSMIHVVLTANTFAGANNGDATCYYDTTGSEADYAQFSNTSSYASTQDLWLSQGNYTYYVKCVDAGGNAAYANVSFGVEQDSNPPAVVRVFHDTTNNLLDIVTNKNATCVYDITDCTYPFDQGIPMSTTDGVTQTIPWSTSNTFYIKCMDAYNITPDPNLCSIIVQPSQS